MSDAAVDTSSEITTKDLKEKKEVVEEAENGRDAPANGNAENEENGEQEADNEVDEEEEEGGEEEEEEEEGDEVQLLLGPPGHSPTQRRVCMGDVACPSCRLSGGRDRSSGMPPWRILLLRNFSKEWQAQFSCSFPSTLFWLPLGGRMPGTLPGWLRIAEWFTWGLILQERKMMEMKMRRLRQLRANGQLKMMRMTMLTPRSRRPMRMTRQQKRKS